MKKIAQKILVGMLLLMVSFFSTEPYMAYTEGEKVKVGIYNMEDFHFMDENGSLSGYCIDYLNVVAGITGWEYEYVMVSDFMDGYEKLKNKEIDLLAPVMMTDARKAEFFYSEIDFGTEYTVLFTNPEQEDLYYEDFHRFNQLKVAVLNDYPLTDYFINYMTIHDFKSELVYFDTTAEAKAALDRGEVDAMVDSIMNVHGEYKVLDRFAPQPFYFLTYKGNYDLLDELDNAMKRIEDTYPTLLEELLHNYYPIYEEEFFTREEVEYVSNRKHLRVAYVPDRKPLSFTDEDGEFAGISREVFDQIAEMSGFEFEYIELPEGKITYDYLQEQKIDLITGVEYNSANMNSQGVFLSRPYISARKVMVSRSDFIYSKDKKYKLAIVEGSKTLPLVINEKYPNLEIVEYTSVEDSFRALFKEEVDMLMQNQYVVDGILEKSMYSSFSVVPIDGLADELCFSTVVPLNGGYGMDKAESTIVISLINKAICQITDVEMDNIVMRETVENKYEEDILDFLYHYRLTLAVMTCAFAIAAVLLFIQLRERKHYHAINEKEARLRVLQQKRYQTIIDGSDDLIYEISVDGDSSMGSEKIKEKFGWEIPTGSQKLTFENAIEILHVYPEDEGIFRQTQLTDGKSTFDDLTLRLCKADGTPIWCRVSRTVLRDKNNKPVSILGKIVDIDDEVKEKQQLEEKSRTDLLTGLLNKQTFEKEVREYVEEHSTESACFIFLDMDHFKAINDTFGHNVGDQVIKETAKKIQLLFANFDLVGRFGGDEFCVFVKDIPRDTLIDRLRFAVKKMEQEYTYPGGSVKISASIGAAYCKKNSVGYKELMDVADAAAYQAKDNGRNCYIIRDVE